VHDYYETPLVTRYASKEMSALFSERRRVILYRTLWLALASAQKQLGLSITDQQLEQMRRHLEEIPFDRIRVLEQKTRHDVMAHILVFGEQCPEAKSIIHLGATSTYVTDNADLIQLKDALHLIRCKLHIVLRHLADFARAHASQACLGWTHYQPAQPTTVGKRAALWLQDLFVDALDWERLHEQLPFLGVKGATGTQASFLMLFQGNEEKVKILEQMIAQKFGFAHIVPLSGQTYSRKIDLSLLQSLASFAAGVHKMATDLRLLAHDQEIREQFGKEQVGSSAMPYKRNPIYAERLCSLARYLIALTHNSADTLATQWLERTLDDSANRRMTLPEAFLTADALLNLLASLIPQLYVDRAQISKNLQQHQAHLVMEQRLMEGVQRGADRQELHEELRRQSREEKEGLSQDFIDIQALVGRAPHQVLEFLEGPIAAFLNRQPQGSVFIPPLER
jgi:adenylosuccinate lyase